jgi:hypothetical protein
VSVTTADAGSGIIRLPLNGPPLATGQDALDAIGEAWGSDASTIVVPVERLDPRFFELRTGVLGELTQKFVNYRIRLVVLGDVSAPTTASDAFRDYVRETNAGDQVWFAADEADLAARLGVSVDEVTA